MRSEGDAGKIENDQKVGMVVDSAWYCGVIL